MTCLTFIRKTVPGVRLEAASGFPMLRPPHHDHAMSSLDDDDGLFIGYGTRPSSLPYSAQNCYDGAKEELTWDVAVMENRHLRAEWMLELGGRLWSLYDKDAKRNLLLDNQEFRPGNLAIRDAWFAGGIEWNIGRRGHDPQTCSRRFAATLEMPDGTPVLRIYDMCRDGQAPFQMDFWLPEDSTMLFMRARIFNPNDVVIPMYWWSNMAVPELPGCRIVVPAMEAYANRYDGKGMGKLALPFGEGFDATFPCNYKSARDHFYNISPSSRKYETVFYSDGYGFLHCSTSRLKGRKLFVWGQSPGGHHWQRRLISPDRPDYLEVQGGIAHSQSECEPMPPRTAWEWMEAYGSLQLSPDKVFGEWEKAIFAVSRAIDEKLPQSELDRLLAETKQTVALKKGTLHCTGSGWGALEERRRGAPLAPQLDFGSIQAEQEPWAELLANGKWPQNCRPSSYLVQDEWFEVLRQNSDSSWQTAYHLALNYLDRFDDERAEQALKRSMAREVNAWNLQAMGVLQWSRGNRDEAVDCLAQALRRCPSDPALAKDIFKCLRSLQAYRELVELYGCLGADAASRPMVRLLYAFGLAYTGELEAAEAILMENGGIQVPDIQEGEQSCSQLYIHIQQKKAEREGKSLDPNEIQIPQSLDLRMHFS